MAIQRQPAVRPAHSGQVQRPPSTKPSKKNTGATTSGGLGFQSGSDIDQRETQREAVRQAIFQRRSNNALKLPNGYLKVAALIIRWDEKIDDFKGHTEEVRIFVSLDAGTWLILRFRSNDFKTSSNNNLATYAKSIRSKIARSRK
jgi:hypothetical protein